MTMRTAGPNVLALNRFYNSQPPVSTYAVTLGPQWRTSYDRYLNIAPSYLAGYISGGATSNLIAERPDGSQMIFFQTGSVYTASDSSDDATLTISGSTYTLTLHDDTVETYTATGGKGVLSSITYRGGYTETLAYNGSGQLSTVTDSYGRALTFTYTGGLLTQVTTPDSLVLTYGYTSGLLTSVSYNTSPVPARSITIRSVFPECAHLGYRRERQHLPKLDLRHLRPRAHEPARHRRERGHHDHRLQRHTTARAR